MAHSSVLLSDEQGIQIIGLSPRAMRARIINQVASHHHQHHGAVPPTTSLCSSTTTDPKPSMSDLNEIIYAVQQPDGEKVTSMIHHHFHLTGYRKAVTLQNGRIFLLLLLICPLRMDLQA